MNVPIIKLEVEGMKYAIKTALSQHAAEMDTYIQAAVEDYCSEENLKAVVMEQAAEAIELAIQDEIGRFFRIGNGRRAMADAVNAVLEKE
jgi:hypothetical protein